MKPSSAKSTSDTLPRPTSTGVLVGGDTVQHLSGDEFPEFASDDILALSAPRTTIRQVRGLFVISTPFGSGRHMLFAYAEMPDGMSATDLARAVEAKSNASAEALANADLATATQAGSFVAALVASIGFRRKRRLEGFVQELTNSGFAHQVVSVSIRGGKVGKFSFSNPELKNAKSELLFLLRALLKAEAPVQNPLDTLDANLLAERLGGRRLNVFLPEANRGVAIIATDVEAQDRTQIDEHLKLIDLLVPVGFFSKSWKRMIGWGIAAATALAVIAYLAVPAPVYIRGATISISGDTQTLALSFPAFMERSFVRPGELIKVGDPIIKLRSPDLEQALEQEKLSKNLEELNASEALEQNDFNSFQLAQSRGDISAKRLEQLEYRASQLDVRAVEDGRVLSVLPNTMAGGFLNVGTELARLQPSQIFEAQVDVNPVDAALLQAGQIGEIFFKGLPGQIFNIETQGVPVLGPAPDGQSLALKIEVKVLDDDQSALIPGLSGYAKIHVGEAPRFYGLFRKLSDYVRFNIWKILGFDI